LISSSLGFTRSAEAIVINPKTETIIYRGAIHDQFGYESSHPEITRHYLKEIIESTLKRDSIKESSSTFNGCLIPYPQTSKTISYVKNISPLLKNKCLTCHTPEGVAPWSMDNYEKIRSWGPMMREAIRTQRMPPWHADPQYGTFKEDASLTTQETYNLVAWIEQDMPYGSGQDPLLAIEDSLHQKKSKNPADLTFSFEEDYLIPAQGKDVFVNIEANNIITQDIWVKAIRIKPSNYRVVHHANIVIIPDTKTLPQEDDLLFKEEWLEQTGEKAMEGRMIAGYSPGSQMLTLPEDTGFFIPKGSKMVFYMHYIPTGKPEKDRTEVQLYLHPKPPRYIQSVKVISNRKINIKPEEKEYFLEAQHTFENDILLTAIQPHMHYRGKSMRFYAYYPDGKSEILLSVPNYKFRWQRIYTLAKPKKIPSGTTLRVEGIYDNSSQNPNNPDSTQRVSYGPGNQQEMLSGILYYVHSSKNNRQHMESL
jgi:hypothetical protein